MKRTAIFLACLLIGQCFTLVGQSFAQIQYKSHTWQNNVLEIETTQGFVRILPMTEKMVEVRYVSQRNTLDSSHAVVLTSQKPKAALKNAKALLTLKVKDLTLIINKTGDFKLAYLYKGDVKMYQNGAFFQRDTLQGFQFNLVENEALYGAGARALPMNRRGKRLLLYNNPHYSYEDYAEVLNYSIPVVVSSKNYMLFFDNATKAYLDLGATEKDKLSFEGLRTGRQAYYFIAGENMCDMLESYTLLTGRQPLPPQWALGNFASRYGYHSEEETRKVIDEFEKQDFPVSAVILDHYWYGEGIVKKNVAMGDLDWYKPKFPNGAKMVSDFRNKGIETVLITQPFMLTNSINFPETSSKKLLATDQKGETFVIKDFWFGESGILDIFKPETQSWYWNKYKTLINQGVQGIWGDLGEPEKHPDDIFHLNRKLKAQEAHNLYGHYWAKTVFEGFKRDYPKVRPFILMRSGFAGSQRFGLIPWSGDVAHSWKGFRGQPALAMSMGLCGVGYMHADAGGFAGGQKDDELYLRWLQYSLFQPIFRPHCQEQIPSEPVFYDEPTKSIAREIVKWRYRFLPYNQTLAYENTKTGKPLMRPLWVAEPNNTTLYDIADTYLWGRDILVAPVFEQGATSRKLYLTKGDIWYDFFTGEKHNGGQWIEKKLDTEKSYFPVFVRGGSCLLTLPDDRLAQKYNTDKLTVTHFVAGKDAKEEEVECNYYLEKSDKESNILEAGFIKIEAEKTGEIELKAVVPQDLQNAQNGFLKRNRQVNLLIKGLENLPTTVTLNGKKLTIIQLQEARKGDGYWNATEKTVQFSFEWKAGEEIEIKWK